MIIDAHNHPDWYGHDFSRFLQNMAQYEIDKTWLLTWESPADEYEASPHYVPLHGDVGPVPFSRCLHYIEQAPDKFVLGYAPDPRRPEAVDQLQAAVELYDVRVYGELKLRMMLDNPDALRLFRVCGRYRLPVVVHLGYEAPTGRTYPRPSWWYGGGIESLERAMLACPETNFVGHAPGFWSHISGDDQQRQALYPQGPILPGGQVLRLLRDCPNLYADLSADSGRRALERDPVFAREFLIEFQDRILFGRDCFDGRHLQTLKALDLPEDVLAKITSQNALKLTAREAANGHTDE